MAPARAKWLMEELAKEAEARLKGDITKGYTYDPEPKEKFHITKVIFNPPATIVYFSDGSKTVVKCGEHEIFDPEKGLAMAITKRCMGNQGRYFNEIKKWTEPWYEENEKKFAEEEGDAVANALKRISEQAIQVGKVIKNCNVHIKQSVVEKKCGDCKYALIPGGEQPCKACLIAVGRPLWQAKVTCQ